MRVVVAALFVTSIVNLYRHCDKSHTVRAFYHEIFFPFSQKSRGPQDFIETLGHATINGGARDKAKDEDIQIFVKAGTKSHATLSVSLFFKIMRGLIFLAILFYCVTAFHVREQQDFSQGFPDNFNLDFVKAGIRRQIYHAIENGQLYWEIDPRLVSQVVDLMSPEFTARNMTLYACKKEWHNFEAASYTYSAVCWK